MTSRRSLESALMVDISALRADAPSRRLAGLIGAVSLAVWLTGCAQQQFARGPHSREYFSEAKYGKASPRVIAEGQPIPHGGGQYLVGRPYVVAGHVYYPAENDSYVAIGMASWYGDAFQGRRTANGEIYDKDSISAAHPTMPLPSYARVTNLGNGRSIIVRVNDRGPYHGGRVMDVSSRVADALEFKGAGTARVKVEYIGKASLAGSDDARLLATLRVDGAPATLDGTPSGAPIMVASNLLAPVESLTSALTGPPPRQQPPEPQPVRAPQAEALAEPQRPLPIHAPLPPARPFDLGAPLAAPIPPAPIPAPPIRTSAFAPAPARLQTVATGGALYFAESRALRLLMQRHGPFERLKTQGAAPASGQP
jgi:rare lipoprotein A